MKKTMQIKLPEGKITKAKIFDDGTCELTIEYKEKSELDDWDNCFVLIEASKLSFEDEFMQYTPKTNEEEVFYNSLREVIKNGIKDFYRPQYDPSYDATGEGIYYGEGRRPVLGKSYEWWEKAAKEFRPDLRSRLGTKSEYIAFLGVLIKILVRNGWPKDKAWNAVCTDSIELGHYRNSKDAKHDFEPTGSREVFEFYDLANTYKILAQDDETGCFWLAGGKYYDNSNNNPLANLNRYCNRYGGNNVSVGWLVLD